MNDRQRRFVEEYLVDLNATAAYLRAGYKAKGNAAAVGASQLLRNPKITDAVQAGMDQRSSRTALTADYVLNGLREVAERCLERAPVMEGRGEDRAQMVDDQGRHVWAFDAAGANKAFELLGKHLRLFTDKVEHSGAMAITISPEDAAL